MFTSIFGIARDIFQLDKVFVPINVMNQHWCCAVVFLQEKRIQLYDSLGWSGNRGNGMIYLRHLLQYLEDEHEHKLGEPMQDVKDWRLVNKEIDTPRQMNGMWGRIYLWRMY